MKRVCTSWTGSSALWLRSGAPTSVVSNPARGSTYPDPLSTGAGYVSCRSRSHRRSSHRRPGLSPRCSSSRSRRRRRTAGGPGRSRTRDMPARCRPSWSSSVGVPRTGARTRGRCTRRSPCVSHDRGEPGTRQPYGPRLFIVSLIDTTSPTATNAGSAVTMNAGPNPNEPADHPASNGPRTNPRSPTNRNTPTAVPLSSSGATSESIGAGGTPAYPLATPSAPSTTMNARGVDTCPNRTVVSARPASHRVVERPPEHDRRDQTRARIDVQRARESEPSGRQTAERPTRDEADVERRVVHAHHAAGAFGGDRSEQERQQRSEEQRRS